MDRKDEDRLDEFEPIELGSVSEETKGTADLHGEGTNGVASFEG